MGEHHLSGIAKLCQARDNRDPLFGREIDIHAEAIHVDEGAALHERLEIVEVL